jgi:hypothetical protein
MSVLKDILNAFWLLLLLIVWILAGKGIFYTGAALSVLFNNFFFIGIGIFLIIFPLPVTIFAYIHYGLWRKADTNKPKWIASNASMHEATWQWFIAVVASIVAWFNIIKLDILKTLWDIKDNLYLPIDIMEYYCYLFYFGWESVYFICELHGEAINGKRDISLFWDKLTEPSDSFYWSFQHYQEDNYFLRWYYYRPLNSDLMRMNIKE